MATKQEKGSSVRRDRLIAIEEDVQKIWKATSLHEVDAHDEKTRETFFVTFPYPYMNGFLHLGHAFTVTKAEFQARFQALNGKHVLWPFGFHCTGMPISAAATKLRREIEADADEAVEEPVVTSTDAPAEVDETAKIGVFRANKSKAKAKAGSVSQRGILESMGISAENIEKFVDAEYWLEYFPPFAKRDLKRFGAAIDWRRSFITTEKNPYYDAFTRWQFNVLKDRFVKFGKREAIWCIGDNQPCADHDRASGEGVKPQEYTLIKLKVQKLTEAMEEKLRDANVFLVAATLRPETMYGQTNCFVLPTGEYGAFLMNNDEVFVCTKRSALNMCYQGLGELIEVNGEKVPNCLMEFTGADLVGLPLSAPLATYETVYVLPMLTISMGKGTGVVTSVPADAPDDYVCLRDWQTRENWRTQYNVKEEWCVPFKPVPIIEIEGSPEYGDAAAIYLSEKLKIGSHKEKEKLNEAKKDVYLKGFYHGKLIVGHAKGQYVKDAKKTVRDIMINSGEALPYWEPENEVISRSGEECIVAFCDQWYLNYSDEAWSAKVMEHVKSDDFTVYNKSTRNAFAHTVDWLGDWACTRTLGLGTRLPWDDKWLIESLSDSTVYMAYYTIAHFLQGGHINGDQVGPLGITAEQCTDELFNYVFGLSETMPEGVPADALNMMRKEFHYWYPMNMRVSGKDLIQNHLTMCLFNHAAIWENKPEMMPRSFYTNGHVMVDAQKMSKSLGNFLTLDQAIQEFTADGVRLACADAGDSVDDANFSREVANQTIMRLYVLEQWATETLKTTTRVGALNFLDKAFLNEMGRLAAAAKAGFESMQYRDALRASWFEMQNLRDEYRELTDGDMHKDLVLKFLEVQALTLSPICPHFCEHLWMNILGKTYPVSKASWPEISVDLLVSRKYAVLQAALRQFRLDRDKSMGKKKDGPKPTSAVIYVAKEYQQWQQGVLKMLQEKLILDEENNPQAGFMKTVKDEPCVTSLSKDLQKKSMQFSSFVIGNGVKAQGREALELELPFDELAMLKAMTNTIMRQLDIKELVIQPSSEAYSKDASDKRNAATPGKPQVTFLFA